MLGRDLYYKPTKIENTPTKTKKLMICSDHAMFHNTTHIFTVGVYTQGNLGKGNTLNSKTISAINIQNPKEIVCGDSSSAVIRTNNSYVVFGDGQNGKLGIDYYFNKLGIGNTNNQLSPVSTFSSYQSITSICFGLDH